MAMLYSPGASVPNAQVKRLRRGEEVLRQGQVRPWFAFQVL